METRSSQIRRCLDRSLRVCMVAALFLPLPALAQQSEPGVRASQRALSQMQVRQFDDRHGLPQSSVQALVQGPDGYIWVGTQEGFARFDGVKFDVFGRRSHPELQRPYIWAMETTQDGSVWIGTEEMGLIRQKDGVHTFYTTEQGLPSLWVTALREDETGTLWVGTATGLARLRGDTLVSFVDSLGDARVFEIAEDPGEAVWIGTRTGLVRADPGGDPASYVHPAPMPGLVTSTMTPAREGGMWMVFFNGTGGLMRDGEFTRWPFQFGGGLGRVSALSEAPNGDLWIGRSDGISRWSQGKLDSMPNVVSQIHTMMHDDEGSLWVGTYGDGLLQVRATPIVPVGAPEGLTDGMMTAMLQDRTGRMWLGSSQGLWVAEQDRLHNLSAGRGEFPSNTIFSIEETRDGAVWVGTQGAGAVRFPPGESVLTAVPTTHFQGLTIRVMAEDSTGAFWLGTDAGLLRQKGDSTRTFTTADGLADDFILAILATRSGDVVVATSRGLSRLAGDRFRPVELTEAGADVRPSALFEDRNGDIWLGTFADGLTRIPADGSPQRRFSTADGLCDDMINGIIDDASGRIWISANTGVYVIGQDDFAAFESGQTSKLPCRNYGRADGMRSRETVGAVDPPAVRARDGRLWFPTTNGVAIIDPVTMRMQDPPARTVIEKVAYDDDVALALDSAVVPAGSENVSFHYTALSFLSPELTRFRYKLEGFDRDWHDAGTRRDAFYTNLPPGKYIFRVTAATPQGEFSPVGASIPIEVLPFFYQVWWFQALVAALLIGSIAAAYVRRMRTLKREAVELQSQVETEKEVARRYRESFENSSDAIFISDLQGRVINTNLSAQKLTGRGPEEFADLRIHELLEPVHAGLDAEAILTAAAGEDRDFFLVQQTGDRVPVEVATFIGESEGRPSLQVIARDVRERNELEKQLRQAQKMEAVGQLASGVAHDFNNLLTIIKGLSSNMLAEMEGELKQDVESILEAADRASKLTRQLLVFSRQDIAQPTALDLNELIRGMESMLRRLISADISVHSILSDEPAIVRADPAQMEQVLLNLIVNARDAMPSGGVIMIQTQVVTQDRAEPMVMLEVRDNGVGMSEDVAARVFEPFFTTKAPGKGTGLGLSTVYGIVKRSSGTITCTSTAGVGTAFRLELPLERSAPASQTPAAAAAPDRSKGAATVLLAEDESAVRMLVARVLRRGGYTVLEARHGKDALTIAQQYSGVIDLLLTDMIMPELNGRGLYDKLRTQRPGVRVLFVSGYTDDEILRRGLLEPGMAFVQKPFAPDALLTAVRMVLAAPAPDRGGHRDNSGAAA